MWIYSIVLNVGSKTFPASVKKNYLLKHSHIQEYFVQIVFILPNLGIIWPLFTPNSNEKDVS